VEKLYRDEEIGEVLLSLVKPDRGDDLVEVLLIEKCYRRDRI
jgi:hypothetical protein